MKNHSKSSVSVPGGPVIRTTSAAFMALAALVWQLVSTVTEAADGAESTRKRGLMIEEVIVTAQKKSESINDVPLAIKAIDGNSMKALGVTDTRDLGKVVPGFTAADNGYNTPVYTLRGIGYADTTYTATQTVGVYVDEVSLPYAVMTKGASVDLERVEVLKGPQGTLFGRNTTGGVVNYIARKPTASFEAGLTASVGNYATHELDGFVSGPLGDTLLGRFSVSVINSDEPWQYSQTRPNDELGLVDKQSARLTLDWEPGESLVRLVLAGWRDRGDSQAPQAVAVVPQNREGAGELALAPTVRDYPPIPLDTDDVRIADWPDGGIGEPPFPVNGAPLRLNDHFWRASLTTIVPIGEMSMTAIANYNRMTTDGTTISNTGLPIVNVEQIIFAGIETTGLEVRFAGPTGGAFEWIAGINGTRDDGFEDHEVYLPSASALFPDPITERQRVSTVFTNSGETAAEGLGVFGKLDWFPTSQWNASLALRYSTQDRDFVGCNKDHPKSMGVGSHTLFAAISLIRFQTVNNVQQGDCLALDENGQSGAFEGNLKEDNISGRVSLSWTPTDRVMTYLSYARGFKAGSFPVVNPSFQSQFDATDQEKLLAWEVGGKITVIESTFHVNFAAFDYDYSDKQLLSYFEDDLLGILPLAVNVPESKVRGAELDFQLWPVNGLLLAVSGAYVDTEVEEFIGTTADGEVDRNFAGDEFNFTPRWSYTVLADYTIAVGDDFEAGVGADYVYTDESNATIEADPLYTMRENANVGARIRFGDIAQRWSIMLWGRNLTDEFSASGVFRAGDAVARTTGKPRTYGITATYNWF